MRRFTIILALLAVAALSPAAAFGKAKGTDRPVSGRTTSTTTIDIAPPGSGTSVGVGQISHLGRTTFTNDFTSVTITGETVSFTLTGIIVAANGDEIFTTAIGTGTLTATGSEATLVSTITGGTGRFTDASGTITTTISSVNVSLVGTTLTSSDTETHTGRVSY